MLSIVCAIKPDVFKWLAINLVLPFWAFCSVYFSPWTCPTAWLGLSTALMVMLHSALMLFLLRLH